MVTLVVAKAESVLIRHHDQFWLRSYLFRDLSVGMGQPKTMVPELHSIPQSGELHDPDAMCIYRALLGEHKKLFLTTSPPESFLSPQMMLRHQQE